jgi:CHAT domain-containing protein
VRGALALLLGAASLTAAAETETLDTARALLDAGRAREALAELDGTREALARAAAVEELELRVRALQALGPDRAVFASLARAAEAARAATEQGADPQRTVGTLQRLADAYQAVGAHYYAVEALRRSSALAREIGDEDSLVRILNALGIAYVEIDRLDAARRAFDEALALLPEQDSRRGAVAVNRLRVLAYAGGGAADFEARVREATADLDAGAHHADAATLRLDVADAVFAFEGWEDARAPGALAADVLTGQPSFDRRQDEARRLTLLARAALARGDGEAARRGAREALLLSTDAPEQAYRVLWLLARTERAAGAVDAALERYEHAVATASTIRAELAARSHAEFRREVLPLYREYVSLLLERARSDAPRRAELVDLARRSMEDLQKAELLEYYDNQCLLPTRTVDVAGLGERTAVVYPIPLDDRLELIVQFGDDLALFRAPVGERHLDATVDFFRESIQDPELTVDARDPGSDTNRLGRELFDAIVGPLEAELERRSTRVLVFVPSGALRTLPFAALFDGEHFLAERFALGTTLGMELTEPAIPPRGRREVLIAGLSESVQGQVALPAVEREVVDVRDRIGGEILLNETFQRDRMISELSEGRHRVVHLATHGHFDRQPEESYLLTHDDRLLLGDVERAVGLRRYGDDPLDLLVLSACETALGDDRAALGLAGVALKSGARSALASLWQISDDATAELIRVFYDALAEGASKAEALRAAQLHLLGHERFAYPFYWSAFLLIGNWA